MPGVGADSRGPLGPGAGARGAQRPVAPPIVRILAVLKKRLRNLVLALMGGAVVAFFFAEELIVLSARPLIVVWQEQFEKNPAIGEPALYFGGLVEPFWAQLSVALWAGIFLASPLIFYQVWGFIAPVLHVRKRRAGIIIAAASALFFVAGAAFGYFLVLPLAYRFFLTYSSANLSEIQSILGATYTLGDPFALQPTFYIEPYLSLTRRLLLGFGLVFELPVIMFVLSWLGIVTSRGLWRFNRIAIVLAFLIAALLTPGPDVISQVLMAAPLILFYNASILVAYLVERRRT